MCWSLVSCPAHERDKTIEHVIASSLAEQKEMETNNIVSTTKPTNNHFG